MRKSVVLILAAMSLPLMLGAQPGRPRPEDLSREEFVQMQSRDMAGWLGLEGETRDRFIRTYCAFRSEIDSVAALSRTAERPGTEEEIDRMMQMNFDISGKILDIRRKYYATFKAFLKPSQIHQMYRFESEAGRRMHDDHGRRGGHGEPGGPERSGHGGPDESGQGGPEHFRMGPPPEYQTGR